MLYWGRRRLRRGLHLHHGNRMRRGLRHRGRRLRHQPLLSLWYTWEAAQSNALHFLTGQEAAAAGEVPWRRSSRALSPAAALSPARAAAIEVLLTSEEATQPYMRYLLRQKKKKRKKRNTCPTCSSPPSTYLLFKGKQYLCASTFSGLTTQAEALRVARSWRDSHERNMYWLLMVEKLESNSCQDTIFPWQCNLYFEKNSSNQSVRLLMLFQK